MPIAPLTAELMGTFPRLPYLHAIQLLNRAWTRVRDIRLWSWQLVTDAQLFVPGIITAGTVSTTAYQTTITVDATAAAALNALPLFPPLAGAVGVGRQIKVGVSSNAVQAANGPRYTITNWDGVSTLTIDRPFGEGTQTLAGYSIYQAYYTTPALPFTNLGGYDASFIRFLSLTNKVTGTTVSGRRLWVTQEQLNRVDPTRGATGEPFSIANYGHNALGQPVFELYPAPISTYTYYVTYYTRWPDVSTTVDFPQVPYGLVNAVMDLARSFACNWAMANAATYPELQQTNWVAAGTNYKQDFLDGLRQCLKQDDEISPHVPYRQGRNQLIFGGSYLQNHDVSGLLLN